MYVFDNKCLEKMIEKVVKDLKLENVVVKQKTDAKGVGYLSEIQRFVLEWSTDRLHVIAKLKAKEMNSEVPIDTFWKTELLMYELILPEFEKIQEKSKTKLVWPHCYGSNRDGADEVLLLEDLSVKGYRMCCLGKSLDLSHAMLALQQLACFHAASLVLKHTHPERFEDILRKREGTRKRFDFTDYLDPSIRFAGDNVDCDNFQDILKKFRSFDFKEKVRYLMNGRNYEHSVITHGDLWVNNLMFQYEGEEPTSAVLLDYQISGYASPLCDLYFMLFLAVDEATRDLHFMDLINAYQQALQHQIVQLEQDPEKVYPKEQLQKDLRIFSYTGIAQTLYMLPIFTNKPEEIEEHFAKLRREPMVKGETFIGAPIVNPTYVKRVEQMARDITRHGLASLW